MHRIRSGSTTNSDMARLVLIDCKENSCGKEASYDRERHIEEREGEEKVGTHVSSFAPSWDVARFLGAISCASGWADLAIGPSRSALLALGSRTCWRLGRPGNLHLPLHSVLLVLGSRTCWLSGSSQRPLAFLYLPLNGSWSNWRLGWPDAPLSCNFSAPYCRSSRLRSGCPGGAHAALSGVAHLRAVCRCFGLGLLHEDPLSTSGMIGYSSCPGDAVTCVSRPIRCLLLLAWTLVWKDSGMDLIRQLLLPTKSQRELRKRRGYSGQRITYFAIVSRWSITLVLDEDLLQSTE